MMANLEIQGGARGGVAPFAAKLVWFGCVTRAAVLDAVVSEARTQGETLTNAVIAGMFTMDAGEGTEPMVGVSVTGATGVQGTVYVRVLDPGGTLEAVPVGVCPMSDSLRLDGGLAALLDGDGDKRKFNPARGVGVGEPLAELLPDAVDGVHHAGGRAPYPLGNDGVGASKGEFVKNGVLQGGEREARRDRFRRWLGQGLLRLGLRLLRPGLPATVPTV